MDSVLSNVLTSICHVFKYICNFKYLNDAIIVYYIKIYLLLKEAVRDF